METSDSVVFIIYKLNDWNALFLNSQEKIFLPFIFL